MAINPASLGTNQVQNLAQELFAQIDKNHTGVVTLSDFENALQSVIQSLTGQRTSGLGSESTAVSPGASSSATSTDGTNAASVGVAETLNIGADASSVENNYTFAGFSPQDHQGASLSDPLNFKYTAYQYLVQQDVNPNQQNWAPTAAAALNQAYGTNLFNAADGQTLTYGDEYIHSASNGYGLLPGGYDPQAGGEFFWG